MKTYNIPITYESIMEFTVEAENLEEAVTKALQQFFSIPDDNYLSDSFEIDSIVEENYPKESYSISKVLKNL